MVPATHERDAEQAFRAGLELCDTARTLKIGVDVSLRCRVGIATGMVIVGERARDGASRNYEILGDTPDLAGHLRMSTQPDAVAIDLTTRKLIGNLFDFRDLDPIETWSGVQPLRRWQVLGESVVANRFEALHGPALTSLVGRDEEIDLLLRRWARAKAGDGQVALITGEPGIGKSRLIAALSERLLTDPHLRMRYFCSPYHQASALFPVIEQLARAAGFLRDDSPDAKREKLEDLLVRATLPDEDIALLADLLSLPATEHKLPTLSPRRKKERALAALVRQVERLARQQPLVVVVEDAHWIDPTSQELLDLIIKRVIGLRMLLIVTFRPEFRPPWTGEPHVTMLALKRLNRHERIALVAGIAGDTPLPDQVIDQIVERADGVPLFVEDLPRAFWRAVTCARKKAATFWIALCHEWRSREACTRR